MQVRHRRLTLQRLEMDANFRGGFDHKLIKAFRKTKAIIRAAPNEKTFFALKGLRFERLQGNRSHQRSMRLNDQFRLIVELVSDGQTVVVVVDIEDYY